MVTTIPVEENSFIGRAEELARVAAALTEARLVTLTGVGGVGKTRLAQHAVTHGQAAVGEDAAWADLSPLRNADLLAATVADALDLSDHTPRMPVDAICAWIADRPALLVLDSCEHLLSACRDLVGELLKGCPRLRILATSRQPLGVEGETVVEIDRMASLDEAVALFTNRAAMAGSPVKDDAGGRLAATLCERLERLPLALELAAAQLRTMPLAELCVAPHAVVDLPVSPQKRVPGRHQALRTTIGWSHELCTPSERLLWARLSLLPGPFDEATACHVAGTAPLPPHEAVQALAALCDKSVVARRGETYRMLDAVREYGRMWLAEIGDEQATADRHAQYVLNQARRAHQEWFGPAQARWYRRIGFLHADIRLAADHLLESDPAAVLELIGHVTFFWVCSGYLYEARQYLERVMRRLPVEGQGRGRVQGLWSLGVALTLQGEHDAARRIADACRGAAQAAQDAEGNARAAYLSGLLHLLEGRPLTAAALLEPSGPVPGVPHREPLTAGGALCRLVHVFALTGSGRLEQARQEALRLRDRCEALGEYWTRSYLDHQLALIAVMEGRAEDAVRHARAALGAKRHIGDAFGIAMVMDVLAIALTDAGRAPSAAYAFGASRRFWETVGHPQRGTPEMTPLRDQCEERLVHLLGGDDYQRVLDRAAASDKRTLLSWGADGGDPPPGN
ncbi:regulator [Streptomyces sp. Act143]|uniref:ATP-binding protein n=1 Tax=Streptomyces sp. Act143 TaxID=2200760 RepID=UPI000D672DF1|nr:NB-ARC domain-containing protein [Streptomyces sp. Act143]PWI12969.1 regulator [Streptomyces sp. Act143]